MGRPSIIGLVIAVIVITGAAIGFIQVNKSNESMVLMQAEAEKNMALAASLEQEEKAAEEAQKRKEYEAERQAETAVQEQRWQQQANERRKVEAWAKWYQPAEKCSPKYGDLNVECVSLRMQARKKFDEWWESQLQAESVSSPPTN